MKAGGPLRTALVGWQTLLADLSLILFMVTAAAMAARPGRIAATHTKPAPAAPKQPCDSPLGEPLALWRAGGSQTLRHWLASEQPDARQQLTIVTHYRKGAEASALVAAQALVKEAGALGKSARIIVAPASAANGEETLAGLAYDQERDVAGTAVAQGLLQETGLPARNQP